VLGYCNTTQAILKNVETDDRKQLNKIVNLSEILTDYHTGITVFISESGLYSLILILRSQKGQIQAEIGIVGGATG
jgi:prophage antirepressor-like protein